ncbi:MAG: hypothetical protein M3Y17_06030 [Actinomycetota bacterium]|nr:hypothetical protein [Actinomycetota bacterium]
MRADYDSAANAISIAITDAPHAEASDEVHARAIVAVAQGRPVEVQLLYPDMGTSEPLAAVADRYGIDREALQAAAQSQLAASSAGPISGVQGGIVDVERPRLGALAHEIDEVVALGV